LACPDEPPVVMIGLGNGLTRLSGGRIKRTSPHFLEKMAVTQADCHFSWFSAQIFVPELNFLC